MLKDISSAQQLANEIETNQSWEWAKNPQNAGKLRDAQAHLKDALDAFGREFLVQDLAQIKKKFSMEQLVTHLETFLNVKPNLDELASCSRRMLSMHAQL